MEATKLTACAVLSADSSTGQNIGHASRNAGSSTREYFQLLDALTCEANVLVFYSLHVESDGGDGGYHFTKLELVQDRRLTGRIQTHLVCFSRRTQGSVGWRSSGGATIRLDSERDDPIQYTMYNF